MRISFEVRKGREMKTQVVLLREEDVIFWFYNSSWVFEEKERVRRDFFEKGAFDVEVLNPRLSYRDFEYLNPIFVEVEATKENKILFKDVVACYVRKDEKIDPRLEPVLNSRIQSWPDQVYEKMMEWKVNSGVEDARRGGRCLLEMISEGEQQDDVKGFDKAIKELVQFKDAGIKRPDSKDWKYLALRYGRDGKNLESGLLGGLADVGLFFKNELSVSEKTLEALRRISRDAKNAAEDQKESVILDGVKKCGGKHAKYYLTLMFYFMLKAECIQGACLNVQKCREIAQHWFQEGFVKEMSTALWLSGVELRAANFAKEYNIWHWQRKGCVASEEAFFPEDSSVFELPSADDTTNVSSVNEPTVPTADVGLDLATQDCSTSKAVVTEPVDAQVNNMKVDECSEGHSQVVEHSALESSRAETSLGESSESDGFTSDGGSKENLSSPKYDKGEKSSKKRQKSGTSAPKKSRRQKKGTLEQQTMFPQSDSDANSGL